MKVGSEPMAQFILKEINKLCMVLKLCLVRDTLYFSKVYLFSIYKYIHTLLISFSPLKSDRIIY